MPEYTDMPKKQIYALVDDGIGEIMTVQMPAGFKAMKEEEELEKNLSGVKRIVAVMSGKGGVGKTTVAVNLAVALSKMGKKVGVMDIDIHGPNVPKMLGVENEKLMGNEKGRIMPVLTSEGIKVVSVGFLLDDPDAAVIWRGPLKIKLIDQFIKDVDWDELDYLIVDLPPGTGDEPLTLGQKLPRKTEAIIVTTPQAVALLDSRKAVTFARKLDMPVLGIVENMSGLICPHCGKEINLFKTGGGEKAANDLNVPFLGRVPIDPDVVDGSDSGRPIVLVKETSPAAVAFMEIARHVDSPEQQ